MAVETPQKRCAVVTKGGTQYLFVVIPSPRPPPKPELEPLMFFEGAPSSPSPSKPPVVEEAEGQYVPASAWQFGSTVVPLQVTGNAELRRSTDFSKTEFASLKEAYDLCGPFDSATEYAALFGFLTLDKPYFLVASEVQMAVQLPFSGTIMKVRETKWISFELPGVAPLKISNTDRNRLREFQEYSYYKGYYYSDDVDLRLPFPFTKPSSSTSMPDFACDWSEHLRQPFQSAALRSACSVLIRGYVGERLTALRDGSNIHLLLLGRQNDLNPGPRYLGRGLNNANGAGNDHFYEYVMWRQHTPTVVTYARHAILRGTIPVHWSTQMSVSLSEPAMIFSDKKEEVLKGSSAYFEQLFVKLQRLMEVDSNRTTKANPRVRCISMLRLNPQSGEDTLARNFLDAVRGAEPAVRSVLPTSSLDLVHVDWLNLIKEYGIDVATSSFWEAAMSFLAKPSSAEDSLMTVGVIYEGGRVERLISQTRFVRINCADSLDRTNLGCFFTCLQLSIAMLMTLQVPFQSFSTEAVIPPLNAAEEAGTDTPYAGAFQPVSIAKQAIPAPFLSTWADARDPKKLPPAVCRKLAELFVENGDCVAMLYTNSLAMHGNILRGVCGMRLTSHNAVIATQRKYENVFEDHKKLRSIELLLGSNQDIHFPSMSPVFLTRPVPYNQWACATTVVGVPPGTKSTDIDAAIRQSWDSFVVPILRQSSNTPVESSALCITVTLQSDETASHDAFAAAVGQLQFDGAVPAEAIDGDVSVPVRNERIAVVEFDPSFCSVIDAPTLLRQRGYLTIRGQNSVLAPYCYPVQVGAESAGMGGAVKNMGTSLAKGFKNFVRNLN